MGNLFSASRGTKEGHSVLFALAVCQVPLIRNNHYARGAYHWVAYSEETMPFWGKLHNNRKYRELCALLSRWIYCGKYSDHSLELG